MRWLISFYFRCRWVTMTNKLTIYDLSIIYHAWWKALFKLFSYGNYFESFICHFIFWFIRRGKSGRTSWGKWPSFFLLWVESPSFLLFVLLRCFNASWLDERKFRLLLHDISFTTFICLMAFWFITKEMTFNSCWFLFMDWTSFNPSDIFYSIVNIFLYEVSCCLAYLYKSLIILLW